MASVKKVTEMLYRIKNGESMTTTEWDTKVVPQTVRSILKKYDLVKTYNEKVPVNQDAELADRFFQAGLELAETVGIHCTDSETVVKFSRKEILDAVKEAPSEIKFGCGTDQVTIKSRGVSDPVKPLYCASLSIQIDEDIYPTLVEGLVSYTKIFGAFVANNNISLELHCGEVVTLLGENGAGKSTLMNVLCGLYHPTNGEIYLEGKEVKINSPADAVRLGIGMVHQHFMLVEAMTVFQNIILGLSYDKSIVINQKKLNVI